MDEPTHAWDTSAVGGPKTPITLGAVVALKRDRKKKTAGYDGRDLHTVSGFVTRVRAAGTERKVELQSTQYSNQPIDVSPIEIEEVIPPPPADKPAPPPDPAAAL